MSEEKDKNHVRQDIRSCSRCRYYVRSEDKYGECRFDPPKIIDTMIDYHNERSGWDWPSSIYRATYFPMTPPEDWCGKFEAFEWS